MTLVPEEISGTGTGTARDCLDQSGPSPDPVQTVPSDTFIPGCIDMVRGSCGGQAGGEVVATLGNLVSECLVHFLAP